MEGISKMSTEALALTSAPARRALNGPTMGARWSAVFYAGEGLDEAALARRLQDAVDAVEAEMSPWRPDSDVERLNRAPIGEWTPVPRNLFLVIEAALEIGEMSGGALDIGVGDLVKAWGLGAGSRAPNLEAIAALAGRKSFRPPQILQLDHSSLRARRLAPLRIDLSAIAKGFGVDELARVMTQFGVSSRLVGIDGELRAAGRKANGRPWAVGHECPNRNARALMGVIEPCDCAVATSGNYRHIVDVGGRTVSHTMDPRSGAPLDNDLASVTVLAPTAMAADGWATALMVLGRERGVALAGNLGLRAVFVTSDGAVVTSEGFDRSQ
jgi:thiamine biosynthesis lipoprotein